MKRIRPTILLMLLTGLFLVGCSEIYVPEVDSVKEALVVQGLITDGNGPFFVTLKKALPYNSDSSVTTTYVSDANLTLTDSEGQTFVLTNQNKGQYWLPSTFKAVTGRSYVLHIETSDGEQYESEAQQLLPPETIDSLYTNFVYKDYINDLKELTTVGGYDVRANLFHNAPSTNPKPLCRFESNIVVQYQYDYYEIDPSNPLPKDWYWFVFGWDTFDLDETTNITDERSNTSTTEIKDHFLCFVPKQPSAYGIIIYPSSTVFYYYRLKQYTINEDTYRFYHEANGQLLASGKLFDPITSQLYGNMSCTSNPSKLVLGLFEVSSVTQSAYLLRKATMSVPYTTNIPLSGKYSYKVYPDNRPTEDSAFLVIPYPSWWSHSK
jgi:hypothetical protein